jgi:hypothetical protein
MLRNIKGGLHGYTGTELSGGVHALFKSAGVHNSQGQRQRIHDLRHNFAVQALLRWYRDGADVQSNLPKLATCASYFVKSPAMHIRRGADHSKLSAASWPKVFSTSHS